MNSPQKILVFRFSSLGDVALSVPVVMGVLDQNPSVSIDFVTPEFMHDLFPKHERLTLIGFDKIEKHKGILGLVQLLKSLDLKQYEAIADLHDVLRTKFLSTLSLINRKKVFVIKKNRKARNLLIQGKIKSPLPHTTEKYAEVFRNIGLEVKLNHKLTPFLFPGAKQSNSIGIAPFARHEGKMYPMEKMEFVVKQLAQNFPILIFGSEKELKTIEHWKKIENVELFKSNNLSDELQKMSEVNVMITMDSANMHLASLVGVSVLSLWGVTHPNAGFLGYGQQSENVIQDEKLKWRPTSIYGSKLGPKDNPNGFENISVEMIVEKVKNVVATKKSLHV